jgi:hypothetical protein
MAHAQGLSGKHAKQWSRQVISANGMNRIGAHRRNLYAGNIQLGPHVQKEAGSRVRERLESRLLRATVSAGRRGGVRFAKVAFAYVACIRS